MSVEPSWHTPREWFVREAGGYRGEVRYLPASMRWHACPWSVGGRRQGAWFDTMGEALAFMASTVPAQARIV